MQIIRVDRNRPILPRSRFTLLPNPRAREGVITRLDATKTKKLINDTDDENVGDEVARKKISKRPDNVMMCNGENGTRLEGIVEKARGTV